MDGATACGVKLLNTYAYVMTSKFRTETVQERLSSVIVA
jgi:hypothetical protein